MPECDSIYLEDVIIEGFKSFSEPTEMSFKKGIGVIIGNNGVGKSNILDAIVWGLGENDISKLRCYSRRELFFSGNRQYHPADIASVSLKFKYRYGDKENIVNLTRKEHLSGKEIYLIDNKESSREEYDAKIDDLNLNFVRKSIIRQEQINDLFTLPPENRLEWARLLFGIDETERAHEVIRSCREPFIKYLTTLVPRYNPDIVLNNGKFDIIISMGSDTKRYVHQMSGGEKAIVSLAFKTALFDQMGSNIYLFDEVEPALDYVNHKSIQSFLKDISKKRQLIIITHLRATVEMADTLHGVRTRPDGTSYMKFYFVMDKRLLRLYKCC